MPKQKNRGYAQIVKLEHNLRDSNIFIREEALAQLARNHSILCSEPILALLCNESSCLVLLRLFSNIGLSRMGTGDIQIWNAIIGAYKRSIQSEEDDGNLLYSTVIEAGLAIFHSCGIQRSMTLGIDERRSFASSLPRYDEIQVIRTACKTLEPGK